MKSKKYLQIIESINESISNGKADSILNRMQFDFEINNKNEFSNYLVILLVLIENGEYEISNNIFFRKVINCPERFEGFISDLNETFELIRSNAVFPFIGISNTIASIITDLIDKSENAEFLKGKVLDKDSLINLNFEFLKTYFSELKKKIIFRQYIRLLYNCIEDIEKHNREVKLFSEACIFLKTILTSREDVFNNYLQHFLRSGGMRYSIPNISSHQIVPEPFFEAIFGSIDNFENLVLDSNSELKNDILKFIKKYKLDKKVFLEDLGLNKDRHEFLRS